MAVSNPVAGAGLPEASLEAVAGEHVRQLCNLCTGFLHWEREEVLKKDPSPKTAQEHRQTLKWLLQAARLLHSLVALPDFPERSSRQLLEAVIWQLDESWKAIYEPLPEAEANRLLAEVFPDAPRV